MIYGFALDHSGGGAFQRVATIASGHNADHVAATSIATSGNLWAYCDNTCANQAAVLRIGADGRFALNRLYTKPAVARRIRTTKGSRSRPSSECDAQGFQSFFWSDDSDYGGHAIYRGSNPLRSRCRRTVSLTVAVRRPYRRN